MTVLGAEKYKFRDGTRTGVFSFMSSEMNGRVEIAGPEIAEVE